MKLQETERLKDEAVSEAEKRIEGVYGERMYELTGLQTKMKSVQSQLKEAFEEAASAKQREEAVKGTVNIPSEFVLSLQPINAPLIPFVLTSPIQR